MKKTMLSEQDKIRVLIACVDLPQVNRPQRAPDYMRAVMATVLDFYMQAKVAIGAQNFFRDHVQRQHHIDSHARLMEVLAGFPDDQGGNTQVSQFLWNNRHWKRVRLMRRLLAYLESIGVTDIPALQAWAQQANFERDFKGRVPGLGLAVFQWLLIRCGVSTVKPDVWVFRFAQRALGRRVSDKAIVALFNEIAPLIDSSLSKIDATIWRFERMGLGDHDLPALRIVFWQQLAKQLKLRIEGNATLGRGTWAIDLDEVTHLRYDQGGLHLASDCIVTERGGSKTPVVIHVMQSSWQTGFDLRVTLDHGNALSEGIWRRLQAALDPTGWVSSDQEFFVTSLGLNANLLMPPTMTIATLLAHVAELAEKVIIALASYCDAQAKAFGTEVA